jgi:cathepsin B
LYKTPEIGSSCSETTYNKAYSADKRKATKAYGLGSVAKIQQDMMQYGSVTGAFTVYADFPTYKSGVYHHTTGSFLGGHAIKIFGWGTENGEDYWLVANSWNPTWGDKGTFKIRRGTNECGIEGMVTAGTAASSQESEFII